MCYRGLLRYSTILVLVVSVRKFPKGARNVRAACHISDVAAVVATLAAASIAIVINRRRHRFPRCRRFIPFGNRNVWAARHFSDVARLVANLVAASITSSSLHTMSTLHSFSEIFGNK
jgi:hypothetical protein